MTTRKPPEEINPYIQRIREYPNIIAPEQNGDMPPFPTPRGDRAVMVEIGSGSGEYMVEFLRRAERPLDYYGFELRYKRLYRTAQKLERAGLHAWLIQHRAEALEEFFAPGSIDRLQINFPDPWSKLRRRKHRMLGLQNLSSFTPLLSKNGRIHFKTDHREYFLWARENLLDAGYHIREYSLDLHRSPMAADDIPTEFERMFTYRKPKPIGALVAQRPS